MLKTLRILLPHPKNYIYNYRTFKNDVRHNLQVGSTVSIIRKITREDILTFANLTNDFNPIHTNDNKPIVHGALLNGFLSGVLGTKLPGPGTIVLEQQLYYRKPCYAGDTIEITVEVLAVRKIIKCGWKLVANGERIVLEGEGKFMLTKLENNDVN